MEGTIGQLLEARGRVVAQGVPFCCIWQLHAVQIAAYLDLDTSRYRSLLRLDMPILWERTMTTHDAINELCLCARHGQSAAQAYLFQVSDPESLQGIAICSLLCAHSTHCQNNLT